MSESLADFIERKIAETPALSLQMHPENWRKVIAALRAAEASQSEGPHRACRLTVLLEADTKEDMLRAVDSLGQSIARDELTKGTWGSPSHGAIYEYLQGDSPTHDEYFAQTRAYLARLRK